MLNIDKKTDGTKAVVALSGRLDTMTAPELDAALKEMDGVKDLTLDLSKLEYVSSAGLRVLLSAQKTMKTRGSMKVRNVCEDVMQIFEVTGFDTFLDIE